MPFYLMGSISAQTEIRLFPCKRMESGGYSNTAEIKKQNKKKHIPFMVCAFLFGGGKRDRTADLLHAMQALYQLSYTPENLVANQGLEPRTQGL